MSTKVKTLPLRSAENSQLLGSWQSGGLCYKWSRSKRAQWHKLHKAGELGEQVDSKYWNHTSRREAKKAAARMRASNGQGTPKVIDWGAWELDQ